jgi:hypothetical protein
MIIRDATLTRRFDVTHELDLGQTAHRLDPANDTLDALSHLLARFVTIVMLLKAAIDSQVLILDRNVWGDQKFSAAADASLAAIALVSKDRGPPVPVPLALEHGQRRLALCRSTGVGELVAPEEGSGQAFVEQAFAVGTEFMADVATSFALKVCATSPRFLLDCTWMCSDLATTARTRHDTFQRPAN